MPDPISVEVEIEFEAALAELEQIVEALERGNPDLKGALAGYGRGVALLGHCQGILDRAERSVALLMGIDDEGQPIRSPFDSAATGPLTSTAPSAVVAVRVDPVPGSEVDRPPSTSDAEAPAATKKSKSMPPASTIPEAPF